MVVTRFVTNPGCRLGIPGGLGHERRLEPLW
jgi:hypothetical protein